MDYYKSGSPVKNLGSPPTLPSVPGLWGTWGSWTFCSVTCHTGTHNRTRVCRNQMYGGEQLCPVGASEEQAQECQSRVCPPGNGKLHAGICQIVDC